MTQAYETCKLNDTLYVSADDLSTKVLAIEINELLDVEIQESKFVYYTLEVLSIPNVVLFTFYDMSPLYTCMSCTLTIEQSLKQDSVMVWFAVSTETMISCGFWII